MYPHPSCNRTEDIVSESKGLFTRTDFTFQLSCFYGIEGELKGRAGLKTGGDKISARQQARGLEFFDGKFSKLSANIIVSISTPITRKTIDPVQFQMFIEMRHAKKSF